MLKKREKIVRVWALILCGLSLVGCGGGGLPRPDEVFSRGSVPPHTREVIVTNDDESLPEGCRPWPVAGLVVRFLDAFNRGSREDLSDVFFVSEAPSPPEFAPVGYEHWSWYSSTETGAGGRVTRDFTTSDQGELLRYLDERHREGERLHLLKLSLTQTNVLNRESNVGFVFVAVRDARDLPPALGGPDRIAYGRGSLNCENLRVFAWRMDMKTQEKRTKREAADSLCTNPPRWRPGEAVVACT